MIYVDSELAPQSGGGGDGGVSRSARGSHPIYRQLREALADYQQSWVGLPQIDIPDGAPLRPGATGERVQRLRERLGLAPEGGYDAELEERVGAFQAAHGLPADGVAGRLTLQALKRGASHYERLIEANLERARALPAPPAQGRYLLVDAAAAQLWMYEDGRPVDSMRVIVGKPTEQTPMLAAYVRYAVVNPYWNVPVDLVQRRIAPNVLDQGLGYLRDRGYEVLSSWRVDAEPIDPTTVDWRAVADGRTEVRVRQLPGPGNMMGDVKFMMSDELGIYLHDTPDRDLFGAADRQLSSGCVRLEDANRLSRWLIGTEPRSASAAPEQRVNLPEPVPVFITYLTVAPSERGLVFRDDVYGRDAVLLSSLAP
ncbi:MAG TPA: L,D-transpeptidase family protein [Allosphingosinicella sp.]|nr:L,D-transpeptidase family protein [Allosphingosinicella sp.]